MITPRGGGDIDQIRLSKLSGGTNADLLATTDSAAKVDNNIVMWLNGNVVDTGIPITSLFAVLGVLLDSDGFPILDSDGGLITI